METGVGYYEFNKEDAYRFAKFIGAYCGEKNGQLVFKSCPYCRAIEKDNQNKFSISLTTGQFECKRASCGVKGNMITLSRDFNFSISSDTDSYYRPETKNYRPARQMPAYTPKDPVLVYMGKRGISTEVVERYRLSLKADSENIMAIPFVNAEGLLECVKYRKMDFDKSVDKNKEWFEKDCKRILFGMGQCNTEIKRIVITEGQMDAMALAEAGIDNPVSVPNGANAFTWIPECWDWVNQFDELVVFGDREKDKVTLVDTIAQRFSHKKVYRIKDADYKDCKDANDILLKYGREALQVAISNAYLVTDDAIIDMADVGDVDIEAIEHFATGFPQLDKVLSGGLHAGSLTVVTGKRGDGKSTFVSQIVCNALNQKDEQGERYKSFIYSGELTNENVKNWMMQQLSGHKIPTSEQKQKVNEFLRGHAYMFDCNKVEDELTDVPKLVEQSICKYGCRVIVIDNLMTAIKAAASDVYQQQAAFSGRMAKIAKRYSAMIILIAHPRKGNDGDKNDIISGSSQITDRADVVIHYERDENNADNNIRRISVTKNRLTGWLVMSRNKKDERLTATYQPECKRIAENGYDVPIYMFEDITDRFDDAVQEELPFD